MRDSEVDSIPRTIKRDDVTEPEKDHGDRVRPFRTLRPITERTDDDHEEQGDIELIERVLVVSSVGELNYPSERA